MHIYPSLTPPCFKTLIQLSFISYKLLLNPLGGKKFKTLGNLSSYVKPSSAQKEPITPEVNTTTPRDCCAFYCSPETGTLLRLGRLQRDTFQQWVITRRSQRASHRNEVSWHAGVQIQRVSLHWKPDMIRSRQASTCFIAPPEPGHGHPSPPDEARSGLGSGGRRAGDSPSQQSRSPARWLERPPETCDCDTAEEPAPSQKQRQQQVSEDCTAALFISKQTSSGLLTGKAQDANRLSQYEEGHRETLAEGTSLCHPNPLILCMCVCL